MVIIIDNYDSFTYNLVQYIGELDVEFEVYRNDVIGISDIKKKQPNHIIISPGPCTPKEGGISTEVVKSFYQEIPILGVCLGHQCIAYAFGADIIRADKVMHGKTSKIFHDETGVFKDLKNPFQATRYHSLIAKKDTVPDCFEITAWTEESEIMGLRHKNFPLEGVQFHPESYLTEEGQKLLKNFLF